MFGSATITMLITRNNQGRHPLGPILVISLISTTILPTNCKLEFDLNELPSDGVNETTNDNYAVIQVPVIKKMVDNVSPVNQLKKIDSKQMEKFIKLHEKVLKLFKVLAICDVENFDISRVEIPNWEAWKSQGSAMLALGKLKQHNLIKKSELPRYKRIMKNCNLIDTKVHEKWEDSMDISQLSSGANYMKEGERHYEMLEKSPLDNLRARFNGEARASGPEKLDLLSETFDTKAVSAKAPFRVRKSAIIKPTTLGKLITRNQEQVYSNNGLQRQMFQFAI